MEKAVHGQKEEAQKDFMNTFKERETTVRAYTAPWRGTIHIFMWGWRNNERVFAKPVEWEKHKPEHEGMDAPPLVSIFEHEAQALMDDLWNCGIRPTEGSGSAGSLAATERHLKDMQRLVFKDKA